jgi:hypothetical protein
LMTTPRVSLVRAAERARHHDHRAT